MKACSICEKELPYSEFYGRGDKKGKGLQSNCKSCVRAKRKIYVLNNREKIKSLELKRAFGIDVQKYNVMFAAQNGCCAICNKHSTEFKKMLAVDHDHESGNIRALLCQHCNHGLGKFEDDPELLIKATEYLIKHKTEAAEKSVVVDISTKKAG